MRIITKNNFAELYQEVCSELLCNYDFEVGPRGLKTRELFNVSLVNTNPLANMFGNEERNIPSKYLCGELLWYFSGRNDLEFISNYSTFWNKISDNGKCNSSYGDLLFNKKDSGQGISQYEWALTSLIKDKNTRQAIMHFNRPMHQYNNNKDFVCTLIGIFHIRENKLYFTIDMRSNDVYFGLTFDYPFFTLLQQQMYFHLKEYYSELELGDYTHIVHSLHLYEKDYNQIREMLEYKFVSMRTPQIKKQLIYTNGYVSDEILEISKNINSTEQKDYQDKLLNWISYNSKLCTDL